MFSKKYEERLKFWNEFRLALETSDDPFNETLNLYNQAPLVNFTVDPYDQKTWLDPWELLHQNEYCEFAKILGICYTLQLTERFMSEKFEITIFTDSEESILRYLLFVQDKVIGYDWSKVIYQNELPNLLLLQASYIMSKSQ